MREFFGFGRYQRAPEGYLSWQHLLFVTSLMVIMAVLAVLIGRRYQSRNEADRNKVLIIAAIIMDGVEIIKIIIHCVRASDPMDWLNNLPLFLCSIQFITVPLAALSRGRLKEASLDFILMFGLLGALLGTYAAGNNYAAYPVISLENVVSGITHATAGFACLYIGLTGMSSMKRKNFFLSSIILLAFCVVSYVVNLFLDNNYMFLMRGDGTPYDILFNLLNGNKVLYPLSVFALFIVYMVLFHLTYHQVKKHRQAPKDIPAITT